VHILDAVQLSVDSFQLFVHCSYYPPWLVGS